MNIKKIVLNKKLITIVSIIVLPTVLVVGYYGAKKVTEAIKKKRDLKNQNTDKDGNAEDK